MGRSRKVDTDITKEVNRPYAPASTPEGRENQLINLAYNLVEQRLLDGTATSAETTAIIRLGTAKARLEKEKLEQEVKLAAAKTESLAAAKRNEELMQEVVKAIRSYQGAEEDEKIF